MGKAALPGALPPGGVSGHRLDEAAAALPCMAGHAIAFADLDRAIQLIEGNGVPVGRDSLGRAFVGRGHNNGAVMVLIEDGPA